MYVENEDCKCYLTLSQLLYKKNKNFTAKASQILPLGFSLLYITRQMGIEFSALNHLWIPVHVFLNQVFVKIQYYRRTNMIT